MSDEYVIIVEKTIREMLKKGYELNDIKTIMFNRINLTINKMKNEGL